MENGYQARFVLLEVPSIHQPRLTYWQSRNYIGIFVVGACLKEELRTCFIFFSFCEKYGIYRVQPNGFNLKARVSLLRTIWFCKFQRKERSGLIVHHYNDCERIYHFAFNRFTLLKRKVKNKIKRIFGKKWKIWPKSEIVDRSKVILCGILQGFQVGSNKIRK